MELKKSSSVIQASSNIEEVNVGVESQHHGARSDNVLSISRKDRQRVPLALQGLLREMMSERRSVNQPEGEPEPKKSRVGLAIRGSLKRATEKLKDVRHCEICEGEISRAENGKEVFMCNCEHKRNFCESCLHHYVIYKVRTFEEVHCPHDGCSAKLEPSSDFFKALPLDIQKNYKKIYQFFMISKDPNLKICPKEDCEGIIRVTGDNLMLCDICTRSFCGNCLLEQHEGECDSHEVLFFEENLHYRRCKKCKFIIEKNQGCNHITCRCGYQFCYVCGDKWSGIHYNAHDENGRPIGNADEAAVEECECCDCGCLDECCGETCASIIKLPFKLFLLVLFIPMMGILWISRDLFVIVGLVIVSILAGLFGFSFELLSELEGFLCVLGVIFFPITMVVGVGVAFREVFCDVVP
jgi:hypothetical protein